MRQTDAETATAETSATLVHERHRVRRPLGGLFWVVAVLVPVALTALTFLTRTDALARDLAEAGETALADAGLRDVRLVVDGRTVVAQVPTGGDPEKALAVLDQVPGISAATAVSVYASAAERRACTGLQRKLDKATGGQLVPFAGSSARLDATALRMLDDVAALLTACRAASVVIGGHTDPGTVDGANISFERAKAMAAHLRRAGVESERLLPRGYADQFPVDRGDGPRAAARNQRGSIVEAGH